MVRPSRSQDAHERPTARTRIVEAAARLFQSQGYAGTGLTEILRASKAPKGSLYHYFPNGKRDLAGEAARVAGARFADTMARMADESASSAQFVVQFTGQLATWLEESRFRQGCPLATLALELAPGDSEASDTLEGVFAAWQDALKLRLEADGIAPERAGRLALLILSSIEGALILSRTARKTEPVLSVGEELAALIESHRGT